MDSLNRYLTLSAGEKLKSKDLLEGLLRCMICLERYQEPKVLQCQHTFCEQCLFGWKKNGGNGHKGLSCPTCRVRTILPDSNISSLPSDFKVTKLGELLKQVMIRERQEKRCCDICVVMGTTHNASHFCAQCQESLCRGCCDKHSTNSLFGTHHVVDLSAPDTISKLFCHEHASKPIKYLCVECSTFICTVCAINGHSTHHAQDLQTGLQGYSRHLREQLMLISDTMYSLRASHEDLAEAQVLAKAAHDDVTELVDETVSAKTKKINCCTNDLLEYISAKSFRPSLQDISWAIRSVKECAMHNATEKSDSIVDKLNEQSRDIISDIELRYEKLAADFITRIDKVAFHVASIDSLHSFVTQLLSNNNTMEILTVYEELSERIQSVLEGTDIDAMTKDLVPFLTFKPDSGECIGEINEEYLTLTKYIKRCQPPLEAAAYPLTNGLNGEAASRATSSSLTSDGSPSEADELAVASMLDLAIEEGSGDSRPNSLYSTDTASTTASNILDESHYVRNSILPPTPESTMYSNGYSDDDLTYASFTRQDPIRRTVSFPINNAESVPSLSRESRLRNSTHDIANNSLPNGHAPMNGDIDSNSMPARSNSESSKNRKSLKDSFKSSSKGNSRPLSVMEPLSGVLPGYEDSQRMKRSTSETPESSDSLGTVKIFDLASPDLKLCLLWEKEGVPRNFTNNKKTFPSNSSKRKASINNDKNMSLGIPEVRHPTDCVFLSNNDLVVADSADRNLQIMNSDLKMWSRVKDRRQPFVTVRPVAWGQIEPTCVIQAPLSLTTHGSPTSNEPLDPTTAIIVTDYKDKSIKTIDTRNKGSCMSTWGKGGFFSSSIFKNPSGVALTSNNQWVISDVAKNRVTIHDIEGRVVNQFGSRGKGGYGFEQPRYVLVDKHGRILVSDSGNGGVKVFDKDGQFLLKIGHKDKSNLTCPMGICEDMCGNFLIADKQRNVMLVFSSDGRYIKMLDIGDQALKNPSGIAISSTGFIAITQTDVPAVKMYTVQI